MALARPLEASVKTPAGLGWERREFCSAPCQSSGHGARQAGKLRVGSRLGSCSNIPAQQQSRAQAMTRRTKVARWAPKNAAQHPPRSGTARCEVGGKAKWKEPPDGCRWMATASL